MSTTISTMVAQNCPICKKRYTPTDMVECTQCKKWIHYGCAGVGDEVANNDTWKCAVCATKVTSGTTKAVSISSSKSDKIRERLRLLEDEEQILKERQQLMSKRQALLEELSENESGSRSSGASLKQNKTTQQDKVQQNKFLEQPCGKSVLTKYIDNLPERRYRQLSAKPIPLYERNAYDDPIKLTENQVATRHAISKELPTFTGHPGEWPVFISTFNQSTAACGFNKSENLIRLQRCLKGKAREVVEAQLTITNCVPIIVSTLRRYFGQPEVIMEHYIDKIKKMTSPRIERMESVVDYAVAVTNLCSTLEQADLQDHMRDPSLLRSLVEKLPPTLQLSWAAHRRSEEDFNNICVLGDWLHSLAGDICDVMPTKRWFQSKDGPNKLKNKNEQLNVHEQQNAHEKQNRASSSEFNRKCQICDGNCKTNSTCSRFIDSNVNERWEFVKRAKLCRQCLKRHPFKCSAPVICSQTNCNGRHHPLLHNIRQDHLGTINENIRNENVMNHIASTSVRFRILPVLLTNNEKQVKTYAFLDEGSSSTLLNDKIANELKLDGESAPLCLKWSGSISRQEKQSKKVSLRISGVHKNAPSFNIKNVRTVKCLNLPNQCLNYERMAERHPHLRNLPVESYDNASPGILIGLRNWHVAVPLKIREASDEDPIAVKCRLGWTIFSTNNEAEEESKFEEHFHVCECQPETDKELHQMVKEFFSVDNLGISGPKDSKIIHEEERAKSILKETTIPLKNHYESGLLWRYENVKLPNSKPMAINRMRCLEKRLDTDTNLKENLTRQIKEYEEKGYIRKLTSKELQEHRDKVWYLPIFPVCNPNKPDKIRIVWDAAAKVDGVSLNTLLMKGIDWNSSLLGVLLRSRERQIGLSADIKEMYHQIKIPPEDQHVLRFLWRNSTDVNFETYVMQVMTFGATCSPSCQYVKNHNALKFSDKFHRAVQSITNNHYVDDLLDSVDEEDEAVQLACQIAKIHSKAGFEIRNWKSNSFKVMNTLNPNSSSEPKDLSLNPESTTEKILGMWWCLKSDEYTFSLRYNKGSKKVLCGECRPTKREVLRILMSIYDPLGLIANFLVYLKILLQDIWRSQLEWDDQLNDDQFEAWMRWLKMLPQVEQLRIPRCYLKQFPNWTEAEVQLHIFVDAGEQACATVAYLRINKDEQIVCSLVGAKTKVAPIKLRSIPRLELDAAVMGCRFAKQLLDEISIKVSKIFCWCDSKTVLGWIRNNPHRYNKYIAFRIAEIQDDQHASSWRYIPSKQNVADEATKWTKSPKLDFNDRWFQGPEFLMCEQDDWPKDVNFPETTEELLNVHIVSQPIIDVKRFSNWKRILKTVAYVIRYLNIKCKFKPDLSTHGILNGDELNEAEKVLFRIAQRDVYGDEVNSLMKKQEKGDTSNSLRQTVHRSSTIRRLCPYLDEQQLLRVKGRLEAATSINAEQKQPVILPRGHHITNLLIQQSHEEFLHANNESVINQLRQRFLIPKLRCAVKSTIRMCQWCKVRKAKPVAPEMAQLPIARVSPYCNPFTFTGVDYFGPLNVAVGRRQEKRWGVLFTCLTTRAVHIEIAHKLDSDSFILCFNDFIQRRGQPKEIYSDRGTNFVGAERQLREDLKSIDPALIAKHFVSPSLKWIFNPPASPHMGGAWERLVRSFKSALYTSLPSRTPSDPLLRSCLVAAENIINSRPLTYVPLDDDLSEALTPNHFLRLNSDGGKPTVKLNDDIKVLKNTYQYKERFANKCWERFIKEYLPDLTLRSKWYEPVPPLKVNDIVVIIDTNLPRNNYPKGRIIAVKTSSDGQVRSATIQTSYGLFERPAVKLALLQVNSDGTTTS